MSDRVVQGENYTIYQGDCLTVLPTLAGPVDAIICDLPYGVTGLAWDSVIPLEPLWKEFERLIKPGGVVALFGSQPFTSALVMSNLEWFRYCWVWDKGQTTDFQKANFRPMRRHEDIAIFANGSMTYHPQKQRRAKVLDTRNWKSPKNGDMMRISSNLTNGKIHTENYPTSILDFKSCADECNNSQRLHPNQKPVPLLKYLILTYTNPGETVLDCTIGSGTTGVAALQTGRRFVGVELDEHYFSVAARRIADAARAAAGLPKQLRGNVEDMQGLPLLEGMAEQPT